MTTDEPLAQKDKKIEELLSLSADKSLLLKLLLETISAYKDQLEMLEKKVTK